ncbi:hypothetical protein BDN70DRAFT_775065, partial [Pholiota conissans]
NPKITIYRISTPASDVDVEKYTRIRLDALRTNPEAFSSTYARDVHLTHEDWRGRVNTPGRTTLAAHRKGASIDAIGDEEEWIGTLSVLHPMMLHEKRGDLPSLPHLAAAVKEGNVERFLLVGMWVHPSVRGMGVGGMLIENAVDVVRESPSEHSDGKEKAKIVFLDVCSANENARKLYRKAGFVE